MSFQHVGKMAFSVAAGNSSSIIIGRYRDFTIIKMLGANSAKSLRSRDIFW